MKAIILAAGKGTRMRPLTETMPKPLIKIAGKPIIEHNLDCIYKSVDEIIIVIKYLGEQIQAYFGDEFRGTKVSYVEQGDDKGTAAALRNIEVNDDVFVLYGDQILEQKDYDKVLNYDGYGALAKRVESPEKYGIYRTDENGFAIELVEKPEEFIGDLANIGGFKFSSEICKIVQDIELSPRGEYEIPDALNIFLKNNEFKIFEAEGEFIDVGCPEDIPVAEKMMFKGMYTKPAFGESNLLEGMGDYDLVLGIPHNQIEKLIEYSQDMSDLELQKNTGDLKRFSSSEKMKNWYNDEDRYLFSMLDKDGTLAGIYWGRPAKKPTIKDVVNEEIYDTVLKNESNIHTNGVRIYGEYRGKRLAKLLLRAEIHYENIFENCHWSTDINQENIASCKGFERNGYVHMANGKNVNNGKAEDNNRRIYVKIPK